MNGYNQSNDETFRDFSRLVRALDLDLKEFERTVEEALNQTSDNCVARNVIFNSN